MRYTAERCNQSCVYRKLVGTTIKPRVCKAGLISPRLVVAEEMDDVKEETRYNLRQLFGEDAFYDTLEDVEKAYRRETGAQSG